VPAFFSNWAISWGRFSSILNLTLRYVQRCLRFALGPALPRKLSLHRSPR
jgi:hypothetical protein